MYYYGFGTFNPAHQSDIGATPARQSAINLPGIQNIFDFQTSTTGQLDAKVVKATFFITGDTAAQRITQLKSVKAMLGERLQLYRRWDDGTLQSINARLIEQKAIRRAENKNVLPCEMTFALMDNTWFGILSETTTVLSVATTFSYDDNISNDGNAPHKTPVFNFTNITADIDDIDIKIYSGTTGDPQWHVTWTNPQETRLAEIEIAPPYVSSGALIRGSEHKQDDWLTIMPGTNRVIVTGTSATSSLTLSIKSYPRWI